MAENQLAEDNALVQELRNPPTSKRAFDKAMRKYGEGVYWQIRRMVLTHDDALDILQNVFLKAWNNLEHFRGDAKLSTWLHKIAVNESINFLNKQKRLPSSTSSLTDNELMQDAMSRLESDEYFTGDEMHRHLHAALATLPDKQRLVFNMRYFDELPYEQISEILGTSVGALKASYHQAVRKIYKYVQKHV